MRTHLALVLGLALWMISPATLLAGSELPKTKGWIEVTTENFTLYSNAPTGRTEKIAIQLERFRQSLGRITRGFQLSSDVPTSMFVFKHDVHYAPYKKDSEGKVRSVSGYFRPRPFRNYITLDANSHSQSMRVVYHEFFHAVMDSTLGSLPTWLNEGLAEYFSTFKDRNGSATIEIGHPIEHHLNHLSRHPLLDWTEFFETTTRSPTYNERSRKGSFYAQAWLLTHYLIADDGRTKQLGQYLGQLRDGKDENEAFEKAFGMSKAEMGAAVDAYGELGSNYVWWDFGEEHAEVATQLRPLDAGEVYFRLGDLLAQSGQREAAELHLTAAREAGRSAASIEAVLGIASHYGDDPEAAEISLRKAVELGTDSAEAYGILGDMLLDRYFDSSAAREMPAATPATVAEARLLLEGALQRQPGHFETLVALGRSFLAARENPERGLQAVELARKMRPLDAYMLQIQAALLARNGEIARACEVIRREIRPKDAERAENAGLLVASGAMIAARTRLEADDRAGAKAILGLALEHLEASVPRSSLVQFHELVSGDGRIILTEGDNSEEDPSMTAFNEAMSLANGGDQAQALLQLKQIVEACEDEQVCSAAGEVIAQLEPAVAHNEFVRQFNIAISQANENDRKGAIESLRQLESTTEDPEKLAKIEEFLNELGARKKKAR
jgi:hypothetical protein